MSVRWRRTGNWGLLALGLVASAVGAAEEATPDAAAPDAAWPSVHDYAPAPALAAAAEREGLARAGLERADAGAAPQPGDTVVIFVVLDERVRQTQWLIELRGPLRERTATTDPQMQDRVVYAMDGREIRFPARREAYVVRAIGPLRTDESDKTVPTRRSEVWMDATCLDEGFNRAARFMLRTGLARREGRLRHDEFFTVLPAPPRPADPAARGRFVAAVGLTDADERAVAAAVPMLTEFARIMADTPGLREVLFSVVKRPSLWSVVSHLGRLDAHVRFRSGEVTVSMGAPVGFSGVGSCYVVPFDFLLNGEKAITCTTLVAEARPPLRLCGGIVALIASSPENTDARLVARVFAARTRKAED